MAVRRIVPNIAAGDLSAASSFYTEILDLDLIMDHGWIQTFAAEATAQPQISVAAEGGSGTPVPDVSIEVDNFDEVYRRIVARAIPVEYGPVTEPWGVRRLFVRDPFARLVNILAHEPCRIVGPTPHREPA